MSKKVKHDMPKKRIISIIIKTVVFAVICVAAFVGIKYCYKIINNYYISRINYSDAQSGDTDIKEYTETPKADKIIKNYAQKHGLSESEYPQSLRVMLEKNQETKNFVLEYPLKKDSAETFDLKECCGGNEVPLLMQWDSRWGYTLYGSDILGITGCGPTSLSMVALYLLGDADMTPSRIASFASENGYCIPGNGTSWTLMSEGAEKLGLDATELPLDEDIMARNLNAGNPIICIMGPGDFTDSGHYIVLTEYKEGKFKVNDPNSRERSKKLWSYDDIKEQIRNIWTYRSAD